MYSQTIRKYIVSAQVAIAVLSILNRNSTISFVLMLLAVFLLCLVLPDFWLMHVREINIKKEREKARQEVLDIISGSTEILSDSELDKIRIAILYSSLNAKELEIALVKMERNQYKIPDIFVSDTCRSCQYFHGANRIVCAIHPDGIGSNQCSDYKKSPEKAISGD